ncbi:WxcM-like domain-containing protein [Treponema denticola]|uniref:WxcM-like domain-containing protein n=1 Tax=Treponema denticola TaxID=158 RepID=A0A9Q9BJY1_TREDN|nr:FdtA/QdtA family cupin domain-containing protein [Treponema denticola]UTC90769.1 WxcM-like domain-containing protein [Treponema denticola]UTC99879.1 WxcM-like domain-containing protein [Treponema denticola]UTD04663.1 WxcM-like domain-containing protein [Treponema denticola]
MIGPTADCKIINLTSQNNITHLNHKSIVPFEIKRIYYLYGVPENQERGAHAHKELLQVLIAAAGSFTVELDDGKNKKKFFLNSPSKGLLIVPGIWRNLTDFSFGSVALVLASEYYTEDDYIRNYYEFLKYRK